MNLVCINNKRNKDYTYHYLEIGKVYKTYEPKIAGGANEWHDSHIHISVMINGSPYTFPKSIFMTIEDYREKQLKSIL